MTTHSPARKGEYMSYDAIFKGRSGTSSTNFLPYLRAVENDVDTYFKEVFAGSVF
jgi:hypothetical protein